MRQSGETALIDSFARAIDAAGVRPRGLVLGVGDDAAIFRSEDDEDIVVTQDIQVEGRHFERSWLGAYQLGWRLAAVNLSDVAAMGARPRFGLFSLVLPAGCGHAYAKQIERGIVAHLARYGAALIGGNVSGTSGPLSCDLTLIGTCGRGKAWRRYARPGDAIVVVGRLGEAAAGLDQLRSQKAVERRGRLVDAYVRPRPLLDVVEALKDTNVVHGAIDVSDGFSTDLIRVCRTAGVGCEVEASTLKASRALSSYCGKKEMDPIEWVLGGGEDYALILVISPRKTDAVLSRLEQFKNLPSRVVGRFTRERTCYMLDKKLGRRRFAPTGWDHLV